MQCNNILYVECLFVPTISLKLILIKRKISRRKMFADEILQIHFSAYFFLFFFFSFIFPFHLCNNGSERIENIPSKRFYCASFIIIFSKQITFLKKIRFISSTWFCRTKVSHETEPKYDSLKKKIVIASQIKYIVVYNITSSFKIQFFLFYSSSGTLVIINVTSSCPRRIKAYKLNSKLATDKKGRKLKNSNAQNMTFYGLFL